MEIDESVATGACNARGTSIIISENGELRTSVGDAHHVLRGLLPRRRMAQVRQEERKCTVKSVLRPDERREGQHRDV